MNLEKSYIWLDVTDLKYSNTRKETFKVFIDYKNTIMINLFRNYSDNKEIYYHVIAQSINGPDPIRGEYYMLSSKELKEKFELIL